MVSLGILQGCFISCGVQGVTNYLDSVKRQLHEFYYRPNPDKMRCQCCNPLALTMSHTEKNPGRLFFKCYRRTYPFFQWADQDPFLQANVSFLPVGGTRTLPRSILVGRIHPQRKVLHGKKGIGCAHPVTCQAFIGSLFSISREASFNPFHFQTWRRYRTIFVSF